MLSFLRQIVVTAVVLVGTLVIWLLYVPSAVSVLERNGIMARLEEYGVLPFMEQFGLVPAEAVAEEQGGRRGGGEARVVAMAVTMNPIADEVTAIGNGQALRTVVASAETAGRIEDIMVASGDFVEKDAVLAQLDNEAEEIALDRARLKKEDAARELNRLQRLVGTGAITSVRLQEAEFALRTAELEVAQAEYNLRRRIVRAPISGWIGLIDVETGQRVSNQGAIATITDRSSILIDFRVPERVIPELEVGQDISISPLALEGLTLTGKVRAVDTIVDRNSRSLRVQGVLDNADDMLRGGMAFFVRMTFSGDSLPTVDPLSVQWSRDGSFVWAVRDGKAVRVPILIRQRTASTVLVEGDLSEGELVVTEGLQNLRPGAPVAVIDPDQARADRSGAPANPQKS